MASQKRKHRAALSSLMLRRRHHMVLLRAVARALASHGILTKTPLALRDSR